jgi:hypothetical protein
MTATQPVAVATVAGMPIQLAWVEDRLAQLRRGRLGRQLPPDGAGEAQRLRRWVVQELVTRAVLVHEARHAGLLPEAPIGEQRHAGRCPELPPEVARVLFDTVTAQVAVPVAEVREYYQRNMDLYRRPETRTIRYRISDTDDAARAPFVQTDVEPAAAGAEQVRWGVMPVRRGELVGPLEDAVFGAAPGDVVGPMELGHGWVVARVEAIVAETTVPFEDVREGIAAELRSAGRSRAFDDWIASRREVLAVIESAYEHPGHPVHGMPHHRH